MYEQKIEPKIKVITTTITDITTVDVCNLGTKVPAEIKLIILSIPPKGHIACSERSGRKGKGADPVSPSTWFTANIPISTKKNICTEYLNHLLLFFIKFSLSFMYLLEF